MASPVGTRARVVLATATFGLGLVAAAAVAAGVGGADLATVTSTTESLMSVLTPFTAVLVVAGLPRPASGWLPLALYAVLVGVWGFAVAVLTTALAGGMGSRVAELMIAGPVVQLVAVGVGAALGVLIRPRWLAMAATVVIPLGIWALLGLVGLTSAQAWLTPYAAVQRVFAAPMTPQAWLQWAVVALIWVVGLNALAVLRGRRRAQRTPER